MATIFTNVVSKIAPKVGIDANEITSIIKDPTAVAKTKLTEIIQKHEQPRVTHMPSNLIPINTTTAQVLAARAAAIAAAKNINAQIMRAKGGETTAPTASTTNNGTSSSTNGAAGDQNAEKEAEQKRLEEEMRKRRERIEKWRNEKKSKDNPQKQPQPATATVAASLASAASAKNKSWNLEDDDEDEEEAAAKQLLQQQQQQQPEVAVKSEPVVKITPIKEEKLNFSETSEEEDPLDAFMREINKTSAPKSKKVETVMAVKKSEPTENSVADLENDGGKKKVTIMMAVAKTKSANVVPSQQPQSKGHIMEQDMDGLEFNSDDEGNYTNGLDELSADAAAAVAKIKSKSEMVFTDHEKVYYRPFRKNFYFEVPELSCLTQQEVEEYREELEGIKVRGKNCPKPVRTWGQCGISTIVLECLKKNNFDKPTPIQAQAIPIVMSGRDMIGIAKTGSGKTLAFLLPMFRHILDQPPLEVDDGPIAIVMTPTRELAVQIAKECRKFTKYLNLNVVCVYGGSSISEQIAELKRGCEIIVCTPGRMIDMLAANNGRVTNLRRITYVVLDEADRMFDMGFEPQVNKILDNIRPDRQTVMFSATFPKKMEDLARKALIKPIEVTVGGRSVVCKEVEQHVVRSFSNFSLFSHK